MAVLKNHVLGIPSGTVGDQITFSTWRGKACLRTLPKSYNDANSELQQAQRAKIALLGSTLTPLCDVINIGWKAYAKSGRNACTPLNAYMKYHLKDVDVSELFNGTYPDFTSINADKLLIARGSLSSATEAFYAAGSLTLQFPDDYEKTNVAYGVLYNPTMQEAVVGSAVTDSSSVSIKLSPRDDWEGDTTLYYFVTDEAGKKASNSSVVEQ